MPKGHGTRKSIQVLVPQNRAKLFKQEMEAMGTKPSAWIRDVIYSYLENSLPAEIYEEAKEKDDSDWRQSVDNRLQGRAMSKLIRLIQNN